MQGKDKDDAVPAIDGGGVQPDGVQSLGHQARPAQQDDPGISPDKRRAHQRHDDEHVEQPLSGHIVPGHQVGDGHAHQSGKQNRKHAHQNRANQGGVIVGFCKESYEVIQGQTFHLVGKHALGDDVVKRVDNKHPQGKNHHKLHKEPEVRPPFLSTGIHRLSTSPLSASYRLIRLGSNRRNTCWPGS